MDNKTAFDFAQGNPKAFTDIIREQAPILLKAAKKMVESDNEALVIIINAFSFLSRRREEFPTPESIEARLWTSIRHSAESYNRITKTNNEQ